MKEYKVPGVSDNFPVIYSYEQLRNFTDKEIQELANSKGMLFESMKNKINEHITAYKSWNKGLANKGEHEEPRDIIKFFHLLSENKQNPAIKNLIEGKTTILEYLTKFMSEKKKEKDLIEAIRQREENKRFIYFDKEGRKWYLGFFKDNFNFNENTHLEWDGKSSKLYLQTLEENYIEFNLRWANKLGIQNTTWQCNLKTSDKSKKLDFEVLGYTMPSKKRKAEKEGGKKKTRKSKKKTKKIKKIKRKSRKFRK